MEGRPVVGGVAVGDGKLEDAGTNWLVFLGESCGNCVSFIQMVHKQRARARHSDTWMTTVKSSRAKKGALSLMSEISTLTMVVEDKGGTPVS